MADWVANLLRGFMMVVLPIAAFAVGIASVDWHDDSLRKAVISKNWGSPSQTADAKKPADAKPDKPQDAQEKKPEPDKKDGGG